MVAQDASQSEVQCVCRDLAAATVVRDSQYFFVKQKLDVNETAIDPLLGIVISEMDWYYYYLVYLGLMLTIAWVALMYYGYARD